MKTSDFINMDDNKKNETNALMNGEKSELVNHLINGLRSEIAQAAMKTRDLVHKDFFPRSKSTCAYTYNKISVRKKHAPFRPPPIIIWEPKWAFRYGGVVSPKVSITAQNLPVDFDKCGTEETKKKILKENHIDRKYGASGKYYFIPFAHKETVRSKKYVIGKIYTVKMSKMCMWDEYESEVKRLLEKEDIVCEFKVAVKVRKKGKSEKKYIGLDEEYTVHPFCHIAGFVLELHYVQVMSF